MYVHFKKNQIYMDKKYIQLNARLLYVHTYIRTLWKWFIVLDRVLMRCINYVCTTLVLDLRHSKGCNLFWHDFPGWIQDQTGTTSQVEITIEWLRERSFWRNLSSNLMYQGVLMHCLYCVCTTLVLDLHKTWW